MHQSQKSATFMYPSQLVNFNGHLTRSYGITSQLVQTASVYIMLHFKKQNMAALSNLKIARNIWVWYLRLTGVHLKAIILRQRPATRQLQCLTLSSSKLRLSWLRMSLQLLTLFLLSNNKFALLVRTVPLDFSIWGKQNVMGLTIL